MVLQGLLRFHKLTIFLHLAMFSFCLLVLCSSDPVLRRKKLSVPLCCEMLESQYRTQVWSIVYCLLGSTGSKLQTEIYMKGQDLHAM